MTRKPNKIKAQGAAFNLLRRYAQADAKPVEIETIAFGEGMDYELAPLSGCVARLVRSPDNKGFARISDKILEPGRVRFTVAHELGHFVMHLGVSQVKACTNGDLSDYKHDPVEIEANIFASEILMPQISFSTCAKACGPTFGEIGDLAAEYNVSLTAAIIRYIDLGPFEFLALVCIGSDQRVKWSKSRHGTWDLQIEPDMRISRQSLATCAFEGRDNVDTTPIHPSTWFSSPRFEELTEECLYMPEYNVVMSLLNVDPF